MPFAADGKGGGQVSREIVVTGSGAAIGLPPGTRVGDWCIDGKIGQGGMGTVHAATHPVIGKRAAIKVVNAELCRSPGTAERFVQEARVVNQICHPSIVDIFDLGQLPDGRPFLVMELLRGQTLAARLEQGRMGALDGIEVLLQIADAMAAAHAHGVVHRDLKPENVYLTEGPGGATVVKIVDWGIAKLRDVGSQAVALTTSGMILGTPQYVSPEQARGKGIDGRTDIYALGVIAYEIFLEAPPFVADSVADMVAMHLREPPPPPADVWPDIPPALDRLLLAMLAKDAADRPSVADIMTTLREVRAELEARATRSSGRRLAAGSTPPPVNPRAPTDAAPGPDALDAIAAADSARFESSGPVALRAVAVGDADAVVPASAPSRRGWWLALAVVVAGVAAIVTLGGGVGSSRPSPAAVAEPATPVTPAGVAAAAPAGAGADPADATGGAAPAGTSAAATAAAPSTTAPVRASELVLEVRTTPPGAAVFVDGRRLPSGKRVRHTLAPGRHEVRVEASGYRTYERTIDVQATTVLDVALRRASRGRPATSERPATHPVDPNATIDPF